MKLVGNVQLIAGNEHSLPAILQLLREEEIQTQANPDLYIRTYKYFGVDEARELAQRASSRALSDDRRIFIVVTPTMTNEAQNALLKTLEEPAAEALFILIVPSPEMLLPTLRSRAQILSLGSNASKGIVDVQIFLKSAPTIRLDMLKPLLEKGDDDKRDTGEGIAFLAELERSLASNVTHNTQGLKALYLARKYFGDKGSLSKALLEEVALLV